MKVFKIINNNVISVISEEKKELVVMGRGVGFQKKPGDVVEKEKVEKVFKIENKQNNENFKELLREVPIELMNVVEDIIQLAKTSLGNKLNENIYLSLTDHINFAIERKKEGMEIKNALLWEIKQIYKKEYLVGIEALKRIEERLHVNLPEDEAGFIAIHLVNAEMNEEVGNTVNMTKFIQQILSIVKYHFSIDFDEENLCYNRFITHLKFFSQRIFTNIHYENTDDYLYILIKEKYKEASVCTEKIKDFVKKEHNHDLTNEELLYLTVHIDRIVKKRVQ